MGAGLLGFGLGALVGSAVTPQTVYVAPPPPVYYAPPPPVYVAPAPVYVAPVYVGPVTMAIRTIEAIATNGFSGHCSRQQNDFASVASASVGSPKGLTGA